MKTNVEIMQMSRQREMMEVNVYDSEGGTNVNVHLLTSIIITRSSERARWKYQAVLPLLKETNNYCHINNYITYSVVFKCIPYIYSNISFF